MTAQSTDLNRRRWAALGLLSVAQFVVVLDGTIVNVALPTIGSSLDFSQDNLSWVVNAYTLTFGGFLLLGGRLADLLGRRRVFMGGLALFALASLAGGFAESETALIAARAVQGLGAALLSPAALSIVTTTFSDGAERNKALGIWGAVAGSGGASGVLLGGVLTEYAGWEWVLWVNVPIGLGAALLAPALIAESHADSRNRAFDLAGAVSITGSLATLVYALVEAPGAGWGSTRTIGLFAAAAALLAAFVAIERRSAAPLVPSTIFRLRTLIGANVVGIHLWAVMYGMIFFTTLYLQGVLGLSAIDAGLAYLPLAIAIMIAAGFASRLVSAIGYKPVICAGMLLIAVSMAWFSRVAADGSYVADVLGPMFLCGMGLGLSFVPQTIAAVSGVAPHEAGLASGLVTTSQQVGGALGLAVLSTVAFSRIDHLASASGGAPTPVMLTDGYAAAFLVASGIAALGLVATLVLVRNRDSRAHSELGKEQAQSVSVGLG